MKSHLHPRVVRPLLLGLGLAFGAALAAPAADVHGSDTSGAPLPGESLYHLQATLTDQHGTAMAWSALRGQPQLVSMFYGNCHLMCPLIVESAKALRRQLPADRRDHLGVALLTLDPARDTPAALAEVAQRHRTPPDWRFLRPEEDAVRVLASVLDVRYRFREDGSINHTSVLVLLDAQGRELARSEVTGAAPDPAFVARVRAALDAPD